jgi:hypothetical protein
LPVGILIPAIEIRIPIYFDNLISNNNFLKVEINSYKNSNRFIGNPCRSFQKVFLMLSRKSKCRQNFLLIS